MDDPISRRVAANLRQIRAARGLSARHVSVRCAQWGYPGLDRSAISKIESDRERRRVTVDELAVLASTLGVQVTELLRAPGDEPRNPDEEPIYVFDDATWLGDVEDRLRQLFDLKLKAQQLTEAIDRMVWNTAEKEN